MLTNIFQRGWNHQLVKEVLPFSAVFWVTSVGVEAFFPGCFIGGSGSSLLKKAFRKVKQGGKMKLMKLILDGSWRLVLRVCGHAWRSWEVNLVFAKVNLSSLRRLRVFMLPRKMEAAQAAAMSGETASKEDEEVRWLCENSWAKSVLDENIHKKEALRREDYMLVIYVYIYNVG